MFRPFNLSQEKALRAIARDAAGEPAVAAMTPAELTLLQLASRISPVQVIQVDPGQLTQAGGATPAVRLAVRFPCEGVVCELGFAEQETGIIYDQMFQIFSTQGNDATLGFDENLNSNPINAAAFFGNFGQNRAVAYKIRNKDDTWSVELENTRAASTSHPILIIGFVPGGES